MALKERIGKWFTPLRALGLAFILAGLAIQLYAMVSASGPHLTGVGVGLLVLGVVIELVGYGFE